MTQMKKKEIALSFCVCMAVAISADGMIFIYMLNLFAMLTTGCIVNTHTQEHIHKQLSAYLVEQIRLKACTIFQMAYDNLWKN